MRKLSHTRGVMTKNFNIRLQNVLFPFLTNVESICVIGERENKVYNVVRHLHSTSHMSRIYFTSQPSNLPHQEVMCLMIADEGEIDLKSNCKIKRCNYYVRV